MLKIFSSIVFSFLLSFSVLAQESKVKVIDVPEMLSILEDDSKPYKVINYWATWCKPCVAEIPQFVEAAKKYKDVEFVFISLDFAEQQKRVETFADKKGMSEYPLYLIDNVDYNSWIDLVSPDWSGAIPMTVIITPDGKYTYEKQFHGEELDQLIQQKTKK